MPRFARMWIGSARMESPVGAVFAVVLPEAGIAEAPLIKERMMVALTRYARQCFGAAGLQLWGRGAGAGWQ